MPMTPTGVLYGPLPPGTELRGKSGSRTYWRCRPSLSTSFGTKAKPKPPTRSCGRSMSTYQTTPMLPHWTGTCSANGVW